jgi:protein-tyrosine phosphatase
MAAAVLRAHVAETGADVIVDSAGTGDWHIGQPMNTRALTQLIRRGYDGEAHRARQIDASWLTERDVMIAMDSANYADLRAMARAVPGAAERIVKFGDIGGLGGADIPDPYGGGAADFAKVLDMLETAAPRILAGLE